MFADFLIPNAFGTTLSKIILRVHDKTLPQQSSTAENWLVVPEKNTDSADKPVPPFLGICRIPDSQRESTGNSRTFGILKAPSQSVSGNS
jgi:hypothetical protein